MRLLLVEDDDSLGKGVQTALTRSGYRVDWVRDGELAIAALNDAKEAFAAVVLDIGLPQCSGMDVLCEVRRAGNRVPILILTARDTMADKIAGFDAGADDYLLKPFDLGELRARLRAIVRRSEGHIASALQLGDLVLNSASRTVTVSGNAVPLTRSEFTLFELLLMRRGRVVSRGEIDSHLHGWRKEHESNVLDVLVSSLRKKIGGGIIQTVRGVGYIVGAGND